MKKYCFILVAMLFCQWSAAQKDTTVLKGEDAKQFLRKINIDTTRFLKTASDEACKCIDSIKVSKKSSDEINEAIVNCIDKQVSGYALAKAMYHSMVDSGGNNVINFISKKSPDYKIYYYEIERVLNDNCTSLRKKAGADNSESENSVARNAESIKSYNKGIPLFEKEDYKAALPFFEKAVALDEKFAFAWDNIGICKRKLGDPDGALLAYNKSLELDPKGKTPLQNVPIVYEYKKDYDKAIEAYKNLSKVYPDDPEAYYGTGRMYELKGDLEKALDYMCKAYKAYIAINSPYRSDAEKNINIYYKRLKDLGKEDRFNSILKDNNINTK